MKFIPEQIAETVPFARTLGVEFTVLSDGGVEARLPNRAELSTLGGGLHGGAIMGVCDLVGALATALSLDDGDLWTTVESTTYFLKAGTGAFVVARGSVTKTGKSLVFVQVDLFADDDAHLARTNQVLAVRRRS